MTWDEIFKTYWENENLWKDGIIQYLKDNYSAPNPKEKEIKLIEGKYIVICDGKEVRLQKKAFEVLRYIHRNKGRIVTKSEIYENVWKDLIVEKETVNVHISIIKRSIPGIPLEIRKNIGIIWN